MLLGHFKTCRDSTAETKDLWANLLVTLIFSNFKGKKAWWAHDGFKTHTHWTWVLNLAQLSIYIYVLSRFSCVRLFETLWTVAIQAPLSMGFSRQEFWSGLSMPSSRGSSRHRAITLGKSPQKQQPLTSSNNSAYASYCVKCFPGTSHFIFTSLKET